MKLVSIKEMIAIEKEATQIGISYDLMMEYAGTGLAEVILETFNQEIGNGIVGLIGSGNNGGDTLVALAALAKRNWLTTAYLVKSRSEDDPLIHRLVESGGNIIDGASDKDFSLIDSLLVSNMILMDGIFGTGIKLPLRGDIPDLLLHIKETLNSLEKEPFVIAVDCPSGVDCDSGEVAPETIPADLTVTMSAIKRGLLNFPAYEYVGDIRVVGIGLPGGGEGLQAWRDIQVSIPDPGWIADSLPKRPDNAHKGTFGTALIIAGSQNYTGAALLAGEAAYRSGTGLVTLAIPASVHNTLAGQLREATWILLPDEGGAIREDAYQEVIDNLERATAILIGPGFGLKPTTGRFLENLLIGKTASTGFPPCVIDADGLKLLAKLEDWWEKIPPRSVLTPHPGEMSVLTGLPIKEIQDSRIEIARELSNKWNQILVLKGAFTVIAEPGGSVAVIPVATSALATAGTGDVLSGIIAGLLAQGVEPYPAAICAAWIHAQAGLVAANTVGNSASVIAGDIVEATVDILNELFNY